MASAEGRKALTQKELKAKLSHASELESQGFRQAAISRKVGVPKTTLSSHGIGATGKLITDPKKLKRANELESQGYKQKEIVKMTGISVSTLRDYGIGKRKKHNPADEAQTAPSTQPRSSRRHFSPEPEPDLPILQQHVDYMEQASQTTDASLNRGMGNKPS